MPTIQHQAELQRFSLTDNGAEIGVLMYQFRDGRLNITHTRVDPKYRGQGLANLLVQAAIREAEHLGVGLDADCDYAEQVLAREGRLC